jgi:hypothetical protein
MACRAAAEASEPELSRGRPLPHAASFPQYRRAGRGGEMGFAPEDEEKNEEEEEEEGEEQKA